MLRVVGSAPRDRLGALSWSWDAGFSERAQARWPTSDCMDMAYGDTACQRKHEPSFRPGFAPGESAEASPPRSGSA